jgi:hypothetical protein
VARKPPTGLLGAADCPVERSLGLSANIDDRPKPPLPEPLPRENRRLKSRLLRSNPLLPSRPPGPEGEASVLPKYVLADEAMSAKSSCIRFHN